MRSHQYFSESLRGKSCSASDRLWEREFPEKPCCHMKKYSSHLLLPNPALTSSLYKDSKCHNVQPIQNFDTYKNFCGKSSTQSVTNLDETNKIKANWKCSVSDRDPIRKSLVCEASSGCVSDRGVRNEVYYLSKQPKSSLLCNNVHPDCVHHCKNTEVPDFAIKPAFVYKVQRNIRDVELELRYQTSKECLTGRLGRRKISRTRAVDPSNLNKDYLTCGNLTIDDFILDNAVGNKKYMKYNLIEQNQTAVNTSLSSAENLQGKISKLMVKTQRMKKWKTNDMTGQDITQFTDEVAEDAKADLVYMSLEPGLMGSKLATNLATIHGAENLSEAKFVNEVDYENATPREAIYEPIFQGEVNEVGQTQAESVISKDVLGFKGEITGNEDLDDVRTANSKSTENVFRMINKNELENGSVSEKINESKSKTQNEMLLSKEGNTDQVYKANPTSAANIYSLNKSDPNLDESDNRLGTSNKDLGNDVSEASRKSKNLQDESVDQSVDKRLSFEEAFDSPYINPSQIDEFSEKLANLLPNRLDVIDNSVELLIFNVIANEGETEMSQEALSQQKKFAQNIGMHMGVDNEFINLESTSSLIIDEYSQTKKSLDNEDRNVNDKGQDVEYRNSRTDKSSRSSLKLRVSKGEEELLVDKDRSSGAMKNRESLKSDKTDDNVMKSKSSNDKRSLTESETSTHERKVSMDTGKEADQKSNKMDILFEIPSDKRSSGEINELQKSTKNKDLPLEESKENMYKSEVKPKTKNGDVDKNKINILKDVLKKTANLNPVDKNATLNTTRHKTCSQLPEGPHTLKEIKQQIDVNRFAGIDYSKAPVQKCNAKELVNATAHVKLTYAKADSSFKRKCVLQTPPIKNNREQVNWKCLNTPNLGYFPKLEFVNKDADQLKCLKSNPKMRNRATGLKITSRNSCKLQRNCLYTFTLMPNKTRQTSDCKLPIKSFCKLVNNTTKCQPMNPSCPPLDITNYTKGSNLVGRYPTFFPTFKSNRQWNTQNLYDKTYLMKPQQYCNRSTKVSLCPNF